MKTWPEPFQAIRDGLKRHEIRVEDGAPFEVNEVIVLREFDPVRQRYTLRFQRVRVGYITRGPEWGLPPGLVVLSIFCLQHGDS